MDQVAKRYGQRPSSLLGIPPDNPVAIDFDVAVMMRGIEAERASARRASEPEVKDLETMTGPVGF